MDTNASTASGFWYVPESDVIYRCIGNDFSEGIVACGFMRKKTADRSQYGFMNEFYSCFVLLEGSGDYVTQEGEVIPLSPGALVQRLPGITHSTRVEPDGKWLEFFLSFGRGLYESLHRLGLLSEKPVQTAVLSAEDREIFSDTVNRLKTASEDELPLLLVELQRVALKLSGYGRDRKREQREEFLEQACDLLAGKLGQKCSLQEVARELHMGYETFRKSFRAKMGISPARYRAQKRMEQAVMMLEAGVPIKETARMTGYSDVYSFTKQFTKSFGLPPRQYVAGHRRESSGN